ncbi:NUDIX hydrolase [Kocuria sp. NPDC057446]|uniref:NUDIX hydrolase n=1 Tax=Kocuria sp. NPDC057446 TaxID=3346137 RepID=UPI00367A4E9F
MGDAYQDLLRVARHGRLLQMEDREPWRIGQIDENYRRSAVLILFGVLDDLPSRAAEHAEGVGRDLDVLLVQRAATLRSHPGQVAFPGGRLDPEDGDLHEVLTVPGGEVSAAHVRAAVREAEEETGLDPRGVEVLGALAPVPLPVSNHLVTPVLGWWRDVSPVDVVDHAESSLVFRVPVLDLIDPANRHCATVTRGRQTYRSPAFTVPVAGTASTVTVWGFTGVLLDRLLSALGWAVPWDAGRLLPAPL